MPAIRHGKAFWPGVQSVVSATYTLSHGISPGVAMLTILPQAEIPGSFGDLVLTDDLTTITIPRCRLERLDVTRDGSGTLWHLSISDRRWQWKDTGAISGWYNQPDRHGRFIPWTIRTPRDLCELCLLALGEQGYQILVPNRALPAVAWDYCSPAAALTQLAEQLGCRVVYRLDTDTVAIVPLGEGIDLPADASIFSEGPSLEGVGRPDSIKLLGAPVRFQARFQLSAVGKDWDGLYRPLEALSYRPAQGWDTVGPPTFAGIQATPRLTRLEAIALAQESCFRCYRLVNRNPDGTDGPLVIPGYGAILRREQVLLEDTKVEQVQPALADERLFDEDNLPLVKHFYDGYRRDVPAEIFGSYNVGQMIKAPVEGELDGARNTDPKKKIGIPFTIDPISQIVTMSQAIYLVSPANKNKVEPPTLFLETGCTIRNPLTNGVERYVREFRFPPPYLGTPALHILKEDVAYNVIGDYEMVEIDEVHRIVEHRLKGVRVASALGFGVDETIARANYYLVAEASKYQLKGGLQRMYNGLEPIWTDGRIQQVTWSIGEPNGATTQASLNTEHSTYVPSYPARLRIEYAPAPGQRPPPGGVGPVVPPDRR